MTRDEERELVARLENWGRCSREHPRQGVCPMFKHVHFEQEEAPAEERRSMSTLRPYDKSDAEAINEAWQSLPKGPEKTLLQVVYALNYRNVMKAASFLGVSRRRFGLLRKRAHYQLYLRLDCHTI